MKNEEEGGEEEREKKGIRIPTLARLLLLEVKDVPLEFGQSRSWSLDSGP